MERKQVLAVLVLPLWLNVFVKGIIRTQNEQYIFQRIAAGSSLEFKVKANKEAYIVFATNSNPKAADPVLEVLIGAANNTITYIKRNRQFPYKAETVTEGILSADEFRGFWINFKPEEISVGRETEVEPFIKWSDPTPTTFTHFAFGSGFGPSAEWLFSVIRTQNERYIYQLTGPERSLEFKVKAKKEAYIVLASNYDPGAKDPILEILLGFSNNTKSSILRNRTYPYKVEVITRGILSANEFRGFWIYFKSGAIAVGKENEVEPFMTWRDLPPTTFTHFGFGSGFDSPAEWITGSGPSVWWVPCSSNIVPPNNVTAFRDPCTNETQYVGRALNDNGEWSLSPVSLHNRHCQGSSGSSISEYEILTGNKFKWIPYMFCEKYTDAVVFKSEIERYAYIIRSANHKGRFEELNLVWNDKSGNNCTYPGTLRSSENHEVLVQ